MTEGHPVSPKVGWGCGRSKCLPNIRGLEHQLRECGNHKKGRYGLSDAACVDCPGPVRYTCDLRVYEVLEALVERHGRSPGVFKGGEYVQGRECQCEHCEEARELVAQAKASMTPISKGGL